MFMNILRFFKRPRQQVVSHGYYSPMDDPDIAKARAAKYDAELVPLLSHPNGFVREAAALRAGKLLPPCILTHLMPRINDWVPQVRAAASAAVEAYMRADKFDDILLALPHVYWLRQCSRGNHEPFIENIERFLAEHRRAGEIPPRIAHSQNIYARSKFDLSWKYRLADATTLINYGLDSHDLPTLRYVCRAIGRLPETERLTFGFRLLKEKTGWLLHEGLMIVAKLDPRAAREAALLHLLVGYAPLRVLAERLSGLTPEELSSLRQETLQSAQKPIKTLLVAIQLSGSLKDKSCERLVENYLKHDNPTLRGAALLALTRLSPAAFSHMILSALDDEAPAVAREASRAFSELSLSMQPDEWQERAKRTGTESHCRRNISLARKANKWDHLGLLLEYSVREKYPQLISREMHVWRDQFNRSFESAKPLQQGWIAINLAKYKGKSPSAHEIAFYCR